MQVDLFVPDFLLNIIYIKYNIIYMKKKNQKQLHEKLFVVKLF